MSTPDNGTSGDDYVGEPDYPAPWTTRQPKEGLRDIDAARIVCLAPDVCLTPIGDTAVPIPYQIVDYAGHDAGYAESVRFTGKRAMTLASRTTHVHGDAPGKKKGVKSGTVEGVTEPIGHAPEVRAEGHPVIRHLDRFWMNNKNTVGEAVFVRDTKTYEPPKDNDPVPGSLVMSDLSADPLIMNAEYAYAAPTTSPAPPTTTPSPAPPSQPPAPIPPAEPSAPRSPPQKPEEVKPKGPNRRGGWGRYAGRGARALISRYLQEFRRQAETKQYSETAEEFCLDLSQDQDLLAAHAYLHARNVMANQWGSSVPKSNPGRDAAARGIMQYEIDNPGTMTHALDGDRGAQAELDDIARRASEGKIETSDVGKCGKAETGIKDNARVDRPECYLLVLTFSTPTKGTKTETQRQLNLQQGALNTKNPCRAAADISNYPNVKALGEAARTVARRGFIQANANALRAVNPNLSPAQAVAMATQAAKGKHAIHTLDMVAGGHPTTFAGLGGGSENSSIGSHWGPGGKARTLSDYAVSQCKNNCPKMQTQLIAI
ncbi:PAAR-like domain-containing protein [Fulvimarina sp. MAC8]|uniref:PAAR-like domain-containing protein n=1 Tax=Fulvimarina sp. MAC8 TaxID=3162874 RepID=UPI0032EF646F